MTTYSLEGLRFTYFKNTQPVAEFDPAILEFTYSESVTSISYSILDNSGTFPEVEFQPQPTSIFLDGRDLQASTTAEQEIYIGQFSYNGNTTYILDVFFEPVNGQFGYDYLFVIGGAPLPDFETAEEINMFFEGVLPTAGPATGAFAPGQPIVLADIPGIMIDQEPVSDLTLNGDDGPNGFTGGAGNDTILGFGGDDTLLGAGGNDLLGGGSGNDLLGGGDGNDVIYGASGANTIYGGLGNDTVQGGTDADVINGGGNGTNQLFGNAGNDSITAGSGGDFIGGGAGNDLIFGGAGGDTIYAGLGDDRIGSGAGNDLIYGGAGSNRLFGGFGTDTIQGGTGADLIYGEGSTGNSLLGNDGNDTIYAGSGNDFMAGGSGNDVLYGGDGANTIYLGAGNDFVGGGAGNDVILAGAGNNRIYGGTGNDTVVSGTGRDVITAGPGADVIVFNSAAQAGIGAGRDVITDFAVGVDKINLDALNLTFIGSAAFSGTAGELRYIPGFVVGDLDGDGVNDFAIELSNAPALTAGDFIL